MYLNQCYYNRY